MNPAIKTPQQCTLYRFTLTNFEKYVKVQARYWYMVIVLDFWVSYWRFGANYCHSCTICSTELEFRFFAQFGDLKMKQTWNQDYEKKKELIFPLTLILVGF